LYELARGGAPLKREDREQAASSRERERLTSLLAEALLRSGYTNPAAAGATEEKLRRLVRRLALNAADAELLLGMLRQVAWKLGQGG